MTGWTYLQNKTIWYYLSISLWNLGFDGLCRWRALRFETKNRLPFGRPFGRSYSTFEGGACGRSPEEPGIPPRFRQHIEHLDLFRIHLADVARRVDLPRSVARHSARISARPLCAPCSSGRSTSGGRLKPRGLGMALGMSRNGAFNARSEMEVGGEGGVRSLKNSTQHSLAGDIRWHIFALWPKLAPHLTRTRCASQQVLWHTLSWFHIWKYKGWSINKYQTIYQD